MNLKIKRIIFIWIGIVMPFWGTVALITMLILSIANTEEFIKHWPIYSGVIFAGLVLIISGAILLNQGHKIKLMPEYKSDAKKPLWIIGTFIPWLNWIPWIYIGTKTKNKQYYFFAFGYAIPLISSMPFMGQDDPPWWATVLALISVFVGIAHSQMKKDEINQSLQGERSSGEL